MRSRKGRGRLAGVDIDPEAIRRARVAAGLSLAQVGGIELTRQAVHLIETGKVRPSMRSLRVLAGRLQVPVASLLAPSSAPVPLYGDSVSELARLCRDHQYDAVLARGREVLDESGAPDQIAWANRYMGEALCRMDRPDEAMDHLQQAHELFEALDDRDSTAETMELEALALHIREDPQALDVAEDALRRYRAGERRRPDIESRLLQRIGTSLLARQEFDRARTHYEGALQVAGGVRDLDRLARLYHGLGISHLGVGDVRPAADLLLKSHTLYEAEERLAGTSLGSDLARVENDLGLHMFQQGDLARAEELVLSAIRRYEQAGLERRLCHPLLTLGELRQRQGRLDEAMAAVEQARDLSQRLNETHGLATSHQQLGELLAAQGRRAEAAASFERAMAIWLAAGMHQSGAECRRLRDEVLGATSEATDSIA